MRPPAQLTELSTSHQEARRSPAPGSPQTEVAARSRPPDPAPHAGACSAAIRESGNDRPCIPIATPAKQDEQRNPISPTHFTIVPIHQPIAPHVSSFIRRILSPSPNLNAPSPGGRRQYLSTYAALRTVPSSGNSYVSLVPGSYVSRVSFPNSNTTAWSFPPASL